MREIKFRGWCDRLKKWVYGSIISRPSEPETNYIVTDGCKFFYDLTNVGMSIEAEYDSCFEVKTDTVGQFTGLKDVDDQDVYEGDILVLSVPSHLPPMYVAWNEKDLRWWLNNKYSWHSFTPIRSELKTEWRVVGNVHDNPELMETKKGS